MNTKLIMEIGCNHQGEMDIAKQMINEAKELGFWAVKFQKRDLGSIPDILKSQKRSLVNSFGETYYDHRKVLEFNTKQIIELKEYSEKSGLIPIVSVFDFVSVKEMILDAGFKYIKLPSQFYTHYVLNRVLFALRVSEKIKIFASTGMHTVDEILDWQYFNKHDLTMYCRSIYPHELEEVSFKSLKILKDVIGNNLAYSSHDRNGEAIKYMVLLGVETIERHYTLNKSWKGSDHSTVSSDKKEMKKIIEDIKEMEALLKSDCQHDILEKEKNIRMVYRGF